MLLAQGQSQPRNLQINKKEIRVLTDRSPVPDHTVFIELVDKGESKTIYVDGEDRRPYYVEIVWTADSNIFGVLEIDHYAENLWIAYKVREQKKIDPEVMKKEIHDALVRRFQLSVHVEKDPGFDPSNWLREQFLSGMIRSSL